MSQFDFGNIDPYVVDGVQLAGFLNEWRDAVHSWHRGPAPPDYVVPGMMWVNDAAGAENWQVMVNFGPTIGNVPIFGYNTTTGAITFVTATGPLTAAILLAQATTAPSVRWNSTANPINAKAWRATTTATGALRFAAYNDAGVETAWIQFNRDGSITTSALAGFMAFKSTGFILLSTVGLVLLTAPVTYGNAGNWYNVANGRFTPPAGRFRLFQNGYVFNSLATSGACSIAIRKNGVEVARNTGTAATNIGIPISVEAFVNANGTDYFDVYGACGASQPEWWSSSFSASPLL